MKWVTRARPKTGRIACPWLIRAFTGSGAEILYVPAIGEGGLDAESDDRKLPDRGSFVYDAPDAWCRRHTRAGQPAP